MPAAVTSQPLPASRFVPGLLTPTAQEFAGSKVLALETAGAADRALTLGTRVADGSVAAGFSFLSMRTGIGGTEAEFARFGRPVNFSDGVLTIDQRNLTNTRALRILNTPSGVAGIRMTSAAGAEYELQPGQFGSPGLVNVTNQGLELRQNSNAYDTTTLQKFTVVTSAGMGTVPAFDFDHSGALNAGQSLVRWRHNGTERARMLGLGSLVLQPGVNQWGIGLASEMINVAGGVWYDLPNATFGFRNLNGAAFLTLNIGSGLASCSGNFLAGNELEAGLVGGGCIVRSPNGNRWRMGVSNAGALTITAL